ncbi:MAG: SPOR domain-containing protein [Magnetococcales bacterium]|nr:SPOR domain-containing protein [Magnetococcales bacterium]
MKISPNREQLTLVMIMSGLIVFIIAVLSFEILFPLQKKEEVAAPRTVAEPPGESGVAPADAPEEVKLSPHEVRLPDSDGKAAESAAKTMESHESPKMESPKNKPPLPTINPAALSGNKPPPKPEEEEKPEKPLPAEGGYTVQLGAFSSEEKASALVAKLSAIKFEGKPLPVTQQTIKVGKQVMYRVRLGPFASQARAKQAAGLASRQAAVEGTVLRPGQ